MTEHIPHYTADTNDNPALPSNSHYWGTESLPRVVGAGAVRRYAREISDALISDARTLHGPVVWVTGNAYMPPLRSISKAEEIYQADNNRDGELFAWLVELIEDHLSAASVLMACPEYDNMLYVVDLKRWQYVEDPDLVSISDINDEWEPVDPSATDDNADNPRE